jgi:hypothetical protein
MAPIETFVDIEKQLTVHTVTGEIASSEIIEVIKTQNETISTKLILWDYSGASVHKLQSPEIREIVSAQKQYSHLRQGRKTAIVVSSDLGHGMSRMDLIGYQIKYKVGDEFRNNTTILSKRGLAVLLISYSNLTND